MNISDHVLKAFLALAEEQKFTVAAQRAHLTQSALSQLIARLEDRVGVRLFERGTRSVKLTPEGERFALSAARVVQEIDTVLGDLKAVAQFEQGQVALAVVPSLAAFWLPGILRGYRAQFPGIRLLISDGSSARCHDMARQGLVDFAMSSQPGEPGEVDSELLFEEPLHIALPDSHRLAQRTQLTLKDLQGLAFMHLHGIHKMLIRTGGELVTARKLLTEAGTVDTGIEVGSLATQAGLVGAGLGACLTPACSLAQFAVRGVTTVQLDPRVALRPIYLSVRNGASLSLAANRLLNEVRSQVQADKVAQRAARRERKV